MNAIPQDTAPRLTVAVIVKNEEIDMPGFLESFSKIADEIVVIDDGSTDRTEEIVRAFGAPVRFIQSPQGKDEGFSDQRNKAVAHSTGDWVLQVDCDMRLTLEIAHEILHRIKDPTKAAYKFRLKQYFITHECRYGGLQYWNQAWLCRRDTITWTQKLHERVHIQGGEEKIGQLSAKMVHLNDQDFSERMRKNYQYSHLECERLLARNKKITLWEMVMQPAWRAFRSYILMRGFRDGKIGLIWATYQFTSNINAYFLAWDHQNRQPREPVDLSDFKRDRSAPHRQSGL